MANSPGDVTRVPRELKREALLAEIENRLNEAEEMVKKLKKSTSVVLESGTELVRRMIEDAETKEGAGGETATVVEDPVSEGEESETNKAEGLTGTVVLTTPSEVRELEANLSPMVNPSANGNASGVERSKELTGTVTLSTLSEVAELEASLSREPADPSSAPDPVSTRTDRRAPQCVETAEDAKLLMGSEPSPPLLSFLRGGTREQCLEVERDRFGRPILRDRDGTAIARDGYDEEDARERRLARERMGLT